MIVRSAVRRSAYYDSVALMQAQQALRSLPGIAEAGVVMGTEANLELLRQAGLDPGGLDTTADDLVVAVRGDTEAHVEAALRAVDALLRARPETGEDEAYRPRTIAAATRMLAGANLALISVPGRFAAGVAREALQAGLNVMLFSDNVPVEDEVKLKHIARSRGLLCMGPDCGTAVIAGAALGFANRVRRGPIGVVGAAGTGLQEVISSVHRLGSGVSHALGAGGRDLSAEVGGAAVLQELTLLGQDPQTAVVVVVSKPPDTMVAGRLTEGAAALGKPVVLALVGARAALGSETLYPVSTLEEAALVAAELAGGAPRSPEGERTWMERATERVNAARARLAPSQRYLRGLYSGGTLCAETIGLFEPVLRPLHSNVRAAGAQALASLGRSEAHTVLDLGADEFTVGRLHPMLDMTLRVQRLAQEGADPTVAVILLDLVLGEGVHPYPAAALAAGISRARAAAASAGRDLVVVATVCGTDEDPQKRAHQVAQLEAVGVLVEETNARAAALAGAIVAGRAGRKTLWARLHYPIRRYSAELAPRTASAVAGDPPRLLSEQPRVVNVGLARFAESLRTQHIPVIDLDWRPPADRDRAMLELLEKLE
jgi:FdrA protein